jgi:alkaline phosphatase D
MDRIQFERLLSREMGRRKTLIGAGALAGLALASTLPATYTTAAATAPVFTAYPFSLGVASGDPWRDSVVLWTRLAPDPLNGGGMPPYKVPVRWQIATDDGFRTVVDEGWTLAAPELAHAVHVTVHALQPDRWYWYRFRVGDIYSPVGRTRTLPAQMAPTQRLRFAFASCQDYENGYYAAYRGMAAEDLDLVVHLGDYIYEYGPDLSKPRQHNSPKIRSLTEYRNRYALYKSDPHLQAAHRAFPWLVTPDDHEVENNYANMISEDPALDPAAFLAQRADAYQAYYEHMPLRIVSKPRDSNIQLYRRHTYGDLAEFSVLDTRQYRSDQPCGDGIQPRCAQAVDPAQTMTGPNQERWLLQGLERSRAKWNVIAQQTMMGELEIPGAVAGTPVPVFNVDQWDGYVAARNRILGFLMHAKPSNPIVITGDIHSSWVHDLKADFNNPASATLGTEFVGTSISSDFPPQFIPAIRASLPANPHIKFFDGAKRGYVRCELTHQQWRTDFRVVETILTDSAPTTTLASFVVLNGRPGALPA